MRQGSITKVIAAATLLVIAAGCGGGPPRLPSIAEGYVGPAVLKIRSDIPLTSSTVTTVKHGDRLEILQRRRRFLRVRTPGGVEGWTDEPQLLNAAEMSQLRDLAARAAKLPVQGQALCFRELNVHTQPASKSPSFLQLKENDRVDVLTHVLTSQTDVQRQPLIPPPEKKKPAAKKGPKKEVKYPPPPVPAPPGLPANWLELSRSGREEDPDPPQTPEEKPKPVSDWSLVRTKTGQSGWVLTRLLSMAIPDDVAQYAEGHRIVSYFALGEVQDGDLKKPIWLWTTVSGRQDFDFQSFRVFIWSLRRHRYETAYIERNLRGYSPVLVHDVDFAGSKSGTPGRYPGFSVCMEGKDGQRHRREYALLGNVVRSAGEQPCEAPASPFNVQQPGTIAAAPADTPEPPKESLLERMKKKLKSLTKRNPAPSEPRP